MRNATWWEIVNQFCICDPFETNHKCNKHYKTLTIYHQFVNVLLKCLFRLLCHFSHLTKIDQNIASHKSGFVWGKEGLVTFFIHTVKTSSQRPSSVMCFAIDGVFKMKFWFFTKFNRKHLKNGLSEKKIVRNHSIAYALEYLHAKFRVPKCCHIVVLPVN